MKFCHRFLGAFFKTNLLVAGLILVSGCQQPVDKNDEEQVPTVTADKYLLKREVSTASVEKIEAFCGDCHEMPKPENFPLEGWRHEVERGFSFYDQSGRNDLVRPNMFDTVAFFTQKAPTRKEFMQNMEAIASPKELHGLFELKELPHIRNVNAIANLEFLDEEKKGFVACDMRDGNVYFHSTDDPGNPSVLTKAQAPINSTLCDLDQDGKRDIMIADIGNYKATDSRKGQVIWLRGTGDGFERVELAKDLGRICQTVIEDFNGDGNNDILVAEFGYFHSGAIYILINDGKGFEKNNFTLKQIDNRHGTVRLAAEDIDQDGDLDFLAAIAQEYETVTIFLNDGNGEFTMKPIFNAGYPSYGTSGFELIDFDLDGDKDVLYTNGDTFDSMLPKSYHSIQWLENLGDLEFKAHTLGHMPGVHCARAADFDGDGDLDVVACAFMSGLEEEIEFDSIIFLENDGKLNFEKFWIEKNNLFYPNLKVADFDQDGVLDFAAGTCNIGEGKGKYMPLKIYLNRRKP